MINHEMLLQLNNQNYRVIHGDLYLPFLPESFIKCTYITVLFHKQQKNVTKYYQW